MENQTRYYAFMARCTNAQTRIFTEEQLEAMPFDAHELDGFEQIGDVVGSAEEAQALLDEEYERRVEEDYDYPFGRPSQNYSNA